MINKSINKKLQSIINALLVIIVAPLFISLFIESPYVPTLQQLFGNKSVNDAELDCISFLNVGQGDAILIRSNGRYALIDTGDGVSTDIVRSLKQNGVKGLDALIITHWHSDHTGGAEKILDYFPVLNVIIPQIPDFTEEEYASAITVNSVAQEAGARFASITQGLVINVGDFRLSVLYYDPQNESENNRSAVIMAKCRDKKFLFMADAESELEKEIIDFGINLDCDVLKVGHHGSSTSTSKDLLSETNPDYAVISVGLKNQYGHPSSTVLNRLYSENIDIYRTDFGGEIIIYVVDDKLEFSQRLIN